MIAEIDIVFKFKTSVKTATIAFSSFKPTVSFKDIDSVSSSI